MPFQIFYKDKPIEGLDGLAKALVGSRIDMQSKTFEDVETGAGIALIFAGMELARRHYDGDITARDIMIPVTAEGWREAQTPRDDGGIDLTIGDMIFEVRSLAQGTPPASLR